MKDQLTLLRAARCSTPITCLIDLEKGIPKALNSVIMQHKMAAIAMHHTKISDTTNLVQATMGHHQTHESPTSACFRITNKPVLPHVH